MVSKNTLRPVTRHCKWPFPYVIRTASSIRYQKKDQFVPWIPAVSDPDRCKQRLMLIEALKIGMTVVMSNHVYVFDEKVNQSGASIGLELLGNIAQVFL